MFDLVLGIGAGSWKMIGLDDELQNCELPSFLVSIVGQECSNYRSNTKMPFFAILFVAKFLQMFGPIIYYNLFLFWNFMNDRGFR